MATDATPNSFAMTPEEQALAQAAVKIATPSLVALSNPTLDVDYMADLIFEDIGGQELINISRNDIINGQNILYQPIKNLTNILFQYNPQNILKLQDTSETYFKNFPIRLEGKIPNCGTGFDYDAVTKQRIPNCRIVYMDKDPDSSTFGSIIIDLVNLQSDEQVEVQVMSSGAILDDTIYEGN
jgi:hypothetical protein